MRIAALALLLMLVSPSPCVAEDIHKEKSLYRSIVVRETGARRCLVFTIKRGDRNQTCMDLINPKLLVFPYVQMTFAGLLIVPEPINILVIGLGGGSIPATLTELFPAATIDVVEIDEAVNRVAKAYFAFRETPRMKVAVMDGRVFVKRAILSKDRYDLIILDAFTGDYIPEHLMTVEFLTEVKSILKDGGVLVANTFSTSALYDHESETYRAVYGDFLNFKMPITGNRVVIATGGSLPPDDVIQARARSLAAVLTPYSVDIASYPEYLRRDRDWDQTKRPLTDEYSPANLLRDE